MSAGRVELHYRHVDVFSENPFGGNSLPVFVGAPELPDDTMLRITQELRHFEAIFLQATAQEDRFRARVFDLFGELRFAGHPVIGAAAVLHERFSARDAQVWTIDLLERSVRVETRRRGPGFDAELDQGAAKFCSDVHDRDAVARLFGLRASDLLDLPLEVVTTGLKYLVVPVRPGVIGRARIQHDLTEALAAHGAEFAVLLDEAAVEARHWNNDGIVEDVATGSAAGVLGAYRLKHGLAQAGAPFDLAQGRFVGRPSLLRVTPYRSPDGALGVKVGGPVAMVGRGVISLA